MNPRSRYISRSKFKNMEVSNLLLCVLPIFLPLSFCDDSKCPSAWTLAPDLQSCSTQIKVTRSLTCSSAQDECAKSDSDQMGEPYANGESYCFRISKPGSENSTSGNDTTGSCLVITPFFYYQTHDWRTCTEPSNVVCQKKSKGVRRKVDFDDHDMSCEPPAIFSYCPIGWTLAPNSRNCAIQLKLTKALTCAAALDKCAQHDSGRPDLEAKKRNECYRLSKSGVPKPWIEGQFDPNICMILTPLFNYHPSNWRTCTEQSNVVCEKKAEAACRKVDSETCKKAAAVNACPYGWLLLSDWHTCVSDLDLTKQLIWPEARRECLKHKADLVTISSQKMSDEIKDFSETRSFASAWLSLTDEEEEGKWVWQLDGGSTQELDYTNWASGHPIKGRHKNCAFVRSFAEGWESVSCREDHTVICESQGENFKGGRVRMDGYSLTWSQANKLCRQHGLRVWTLRSESDSKKSDEFTLRPRERLMGLFRDPETDKWEWTSGLKLSEMSFQKWNSGEPDGSGACSSFSAEGTWRDVSCVQKGYFLCQKPARGGPRNTRLVMFSDIDGEEESGETIRLTCSADDAKGTLGWSVYTEERGAEPLKADKMSTKFELVKNDEGLCTNRTVATIEITVKENLQGARVSCFASPQKTTRKCGVLGVSQKVCSISPPIKVWVRPNVKSVKKDKPSMTRGVAYGLAMLGVHLVLVLVVANFTGRACTAKDPDKSKRIKEMWSLSSKDGSVEKAADTAPVGSV